MSLSRDTIAKKRDGQPGPEKLRKGKYVNFLKMFYSKLCGKS